MSKSQKEGYWDMMDRATTTSKDWGFIPIPGKGGDTLNASIPDEEEKRKVAKKKSKEA